MDYLSTVFIFCLILFFYLHIYYHLKTSDDLEVYTLSMPSKDKLEEICSVRQPVLFPFKNELITNTFSLLSLEKNQGVFDINIRKKGDDLYLPILLKSAIKLFKNDKGEEYYSENNQDLLQETGLHKILRNNDYFLRPPMVSSCVYDYCSGSLNCQTPLRYSLNYRNYLYVTEGNIKIKLISPIYTKYLYEDKDYDNFEFNSPINPWNIQDEYKTEFNKVKFIEIELKKNDIIYIPAYWWYSIQYMKSTSLLMFKYRTYMNTVAIFPHILIKTLQKLNMKWDIVNKITNKEVEIKTDTKFLSDKPATPLPIIPEETENHDGPHE